MNYHLIISLLQY